MKKLCIFGAGGSAKETYWIAKRCGYDVAAFIDTNDKGSYHEVPILSEQHFDKNKHVAIVAVGNSTLRKKIVEQVLSKYGNIFVSLLDPSIIQLSPNIKIGIGAVIAPQCILTCDIHIGAFCQLNIGTSIMHDTVIGDFFTAAPGARINGKVNIGNEVYCGSNSIVKEQINIIDNVIIGAGACVVKSITQNGTYVGIPAKLLIKS